MVVIGDRGTKVLWVFAVAVFLFSAAVPAAMASDDPDKVTFTLQPYLWIPLIEGTLRYTTLPNRSSGSP